jgi:hypothetical protein
MSAVLGHNNPIPDDIAKFDICNFRDQPRSLKSEEISQKCQCTALVWR